MATPAEIIARANSYLGRITPALDEILRLLRLDLPGCIEYANTQFKLGLPAIEIWDYAQARNEVFPAILVSTSLQTEEFGIGHMDVHNVVVFVAYERQENRYEAQKAADIADLVRAVMLGYKDRKTDPVGRIVWNDLLPSGETQIPPEWAQWSGWGVHFQMRQTPGQTLWA